MRTKLRRIESQKDPSRLHLFVFLLDLTMGWYSRTRRGLSVPYDTYASTHVPLDDARCSGSLTKGRAGHDNRRRFLYDNKLY